MWSGVVEESIVAWIVAVQVIGWFAGRYFELRIGFFPVWFLDCTACLPRGGWIESSVPLVGGMSYWVVIAVVASSVLAIGKRSGMGGRVFRGAAAVGRMLRDLHDAVASYRPAPDAIWPPWFGRELGGPDRIISHCDVAPWNIIARNGLPVGLIDWEYAGPVDPLIELAQTCWLNARLFSDDVAERENLPSVAERARQLGAMVDAYGLSARQRSGFFDRIIEIVVHDTAFQADEAGVTPDTTDPEALWGLAWRARSAAWLLSNREVIEHAIS